MEQLAYTLLGVFIGLGLSAFIRRKVNEEIYIRGLNDGACLVMPHLDDARQEIQTLHEVMNNEAKHKTVH
jgi:hypothetical protein